MAEGEREQHRVPEQLKPKLFVGNHQQMLRDIEQSLKHLKKKPEKKKDATADRFKHGHEGNHGCLRANKSSERTFEQACGSQPESPV